MGAKISNRFKIFLAGSIEQGIAEDWQSYVEKALSNDDRYCLLNPRRDNWDNTWEQSIKNTQFKEQVNWELDALELSDLIIMYFDASTKSPISLLEFGLFAKSNKLAVICSQGFWRKGNVDVICERFNILKFNNLDEIIKQLKQR